VDDLERMERFYSNRDERKWSLFNCYPFLLDCKQTYLMTKILNGINLKESTFLDIGAGAGNFILKMLSLGVMPENILAVEYLEERHKKFKEKLPNISCINDDFKNVGLDKKYDIITLMAVLTSITDNNVRYSILEKAMANISSGGVLVLYDYFNDKELYLSENYRALSLEKVKFFSKGYKVDIYKNVYIRSWVAKGLCKIGLRSLVPLVESLKFLNDSYHFVVIKNER